MRKVYIVFYDLWIDVCSSWDFHPCDEMLAFERHLLVGNKFFLYSTGDFIYMFIDIFDRLIFSDKV
ncbi:hypothetical protein KBC03_04440 [Patescibacteria group bacterium]|nr:hypothetical protein [Patescibacteria group bacterium]